MSWLDDLPTAVDKEKLQNLRQQLQQKALEERWQAWRDALHSVSDCTASILDAAGPVIRIGSPNDLNSEQKARVQQALKAFMPWKKGPYEIFGELIDSEWRSDQKWERLLPHVQSLEGEMVADIGCHNGYFLYRMRALGARAVLGFEPVPIHFYNFELLQTFYPTPELAHEPFGVEHIDYFPQSFDSIFCLGILYHHTDPVGLLRKMRSALKANGRLFIDCQGIAGEDSLALVPSGRYAGASGVWFLPTLSCLENWIRRAGFSRIKRLYSAPLSCDEQRATAWAPLKSLEDFLDPHDPKQTREGYPAPWRHYLQVQI